MADKIVKLVDKNSNNLYPVAGAVIDNAVSTGAISSQAVTTAKIANGAVASDKIDWTTFLYDRALYYKFSIGYGNTEWNNKREFTIPLASLSSLDIKAGDSVLLSFCSRWHDDTYAVRNFVEVTGSVSWDLEAVCNTPIDKEVMINFTDIVVVGSTGIPIALKSNDYTRNNMFGTIIIRKLISATNIS